MATLAEGAGFSTALSLGLLGFWLALGMRSFRVVAAVLITLLSGLVACAAFAVWAVGPFNPISVAFAPLFIGIAIDFGIQFSVRFGAETLSGGTPAEAFRRTSCGVGAPLAIAAGATAVGFLSFVPTDYTGVSTLGLIAGVGMLIALVLNLTLLPALLSLFGSGGAAHATGLPFGQAMDRAIVGWRTWILAGAAALAACAALALPRLQFDFNPINLQSPRSESVATLFDLMKDPLRTPYTIGILAASPSAARTLSRQIAALPGVEQVLDAESFVPGDQDAKLEILRDADSLLGPTLRPQAVRPPPSPDEVLASIARCAARLEELARKGDPTVASFAQALRSVLAGGKAVLPALEANLSDGVGRRLDDLGLALQAAPVSVATMPPEIKVDWIAPDGRWRLQVFPKGDSRNNDVLRGFCESVMRIAPDATGMPVTIQESAHMVTRAFATAGLTAVAAIAALLFAVLRRPRDVAVVLAPLLLAGLLTLATGVVIGLPLNFANIITLPLLLGIGVAFDIYFVMRWRAGEAGLLSSSTARAVLFSALTTGTAFGSLALSKSPGMADMGKLLSVALSYTLLCTLFILPALLGPQPPAPRPGDKT
jgi:hopanoid biosynthesis associated RND transporter like protein HpnN